MRIGTLFKFLVGLVFLAIVAVIVAVLVFDPNAYKEDIVAAVRDETGRTFSIDSDIDLQLGLTPSLAVRGVRFGNAEWGSRPDMVTVGEFAAEVAVIPLITGDLQINRLVLRDADILIETDAAGRRNFDVAAGGKRKERGAGTTRLPQINDVLIENAVVTIVDAGKGTRTTLTIARLVAAADSLTSPLTIELAGSATLDDRPVTFDVVGEVGGPALLVERGRPYPVNLAANALGLKVELNGQIAEPVRARGIDLKVAVTGDDLQGLRAVAGDGLPAAGPVQLAARVVGDTDHLALEDLVVGFGRSDLRGRAALDGRGARPRLTAALRSDRLDLNEFLPAGGAPEPTQQPRAGAAQEKLFSAEPLPLDLLRTFDATLDFEVGQLITPAASMTEATGKLALDNGALAVRPLAGKLAGGMLSGEITVDARADPPRVALQALAPELDLGAVLREVAEIDHLRGAGIVDVSVRGSGRSVAAIMASLNGHARLLMGKGEMKNEFLGNISGLGQTLGEAFGKKEWIAVECLASDFEIAQGVATSRFNVINTELLLITADGKIDLGRETPAIKVTPRSKGIDLSLAVPVNIGGTLASPTFSPDALATARKVGGILGAVVFPPAAIIGLGEMGATDNPCLQLASDGAAPPPQRQPKSTIEAVPEKAREAIEGIGEGLQRILGR